MNWAVIYDSDQVQRFDDQAAAMQFAEANTRRHQTPATVYKLKHEFLAVSKQVSERQLLRYVAKEQGVDLDNFDIDEKKQAIIDRRVSRGTDTDVTAV
jgi:hypothetical protein